MNDERVCAVLCVCEQKVNKNLCVCHMPHMVYGFFLTLFRTEQRKPMRDFLFRQFICQKYASVACGVSLRIKTQLEIWDDGALAYIGLYWSHAMLMEGATFLLNLDRSRACGWMPSIIIIFIFLMPLLGNQHHQSEWKYYSKNFTAGAADDSQLSWFIYQWNDVGTFNEAKTNCYFRFQMWLGS